MQYPKINLAIDNCFAAKRFARPKDWVQIISDCGVHCTELNADCEFDPLYCDADFLRDWTEEVQEACKKHDIRVTSLHSGHGSYSICGLGSPDARYRRRLVEDWIAPFGRIASEFSCGIGFYMHCFSQEMMGDKTEYQKAVTQLYETMRQIRKHPDTQGLPFVSVEQMYSPQHIPWTIEGAKEFIRNTGMYITIDTGHTCGQSRFIMPSAADIEAAAEKGEPIYLGVERAYAMFDDLKAHRNGITAGDILEVLSENSHLFAQEEDGDIYAWLSALGHLSPIIHLQQTDGTRSAHTSFTAEENEHGIIHPVKVLEAIKNACDRSADLGIAPCAEINLTLELFYPAVDTAQQILKKIKESASYWRQFIPSDGMRLDALIKLIK